LVEVERWAGFARFRRFPRHPHTLPHLYPTQEDTHVNTTRRGRTALALVAASALVFAACGSDDDGADTGDTGGETTEAPDGTEAPDTTDDMTEDTTDSGGEAAGNVGEVGGSACGTPHGPYDEGDDPAGEVRVAWNQAPYSFNEDSSRGNATANANPLYVMKAGGFSYYDEDLNYINNDQFGTCTLDSLDPLTITYTINEGVTWSDGVQVDAADLLMSWAAQSGVYNDAETVVTDTGVTAQADENGSAVVVGPDGADITSVDEAAYDAAFDPETGALLDGYTFKESTGVSFDSSSESLSLVTTVPEISEDGLSLTATWDSFYVDYATGGVDPGVPAHVVARNALGIDDPTEAKAALIEALQGSTEDVKAISESWNRDFDATSLPDDPSVYAGFGPYNLTSFDDDGTMVFEAREDYTWGPQPKVQTIVYSIIGDPTAAVQAMTNEEVDIIQPQATADILTQLEGIADRGVEVKQSDGAVYEHVDLVFNNGGPFDPATYGGDEETAKAVRQAFLLAVPRTDIVERLIVPLNENAEVRDSLIQVPGSPLYDEATSNNGSDFYGEADPEAAAQLLADAGVDTSTPIDVRLLFADENPRRASEYELIRDSVAQAGFNLVDGRDINWGSNLSNNTLYDASLFGWQTTAIAVADSAANFVTDGQNNYGGYSNETVDALFAELQATTDPARQDELLVEIESVLFDDAFGLPIFQFPQITAFNSTYVSGVSDIPISPTVFFNVWDWEAAG
jgi:peptide/nickel transport system substrate-binding protein